MRRGRPTDCGPRSPLTRRCLRSDGTLATRRSAARGTGPLVYVDVTIVEFAQHTAYLDPRAGTGYLVTPGPAAGVAGEDDWLHALDHLEQLGWELLRDEEGRIEEAGWTTGGLLAVCLYGSEPPTIEPTLENLRRSLAALGLAADLEQRASN
ncbi:hypothetical protein [Kribbella sp. CA-293567]|uniref:hypothetical protein n=1 Tax=Kribbella sp. CA-293567 TaxID=3002436 RepID=UPI0022DE60CC|nr:hypothetical protein [Kribbella sp. CA-293567]WBQ02076.1 hypothetical protein OX958_18985 [Kribbella sp. CA-293567]